MKKILLTIAFAFAISVAASAQIMNVIGDSYVKNHRKPVEETWHYKLAKELGFTYNNYGRNGNCIAFDRTNDNGKNWGKPMWQRCMDMDENADYVIIIAGHNDADKIRYDKKMLNMFADSLTTLIVNVRNHCPKAKIGIVGPWYVPQPGFEGVCKTMQKVCKKQKVPFLNNYSSDCVINVRDAKFRKDFFQSPTDYAHLNADGHEVFLPVARDWFQEQVVKEK